MPIVYPELDFAAQMQELERRCQATGRPAAPVTTAQWEIDEPLMEQSARLGVDRHAFHRPGPGDLAASSKP